MALDNIELKISGGESSPCSGLRDRVRARCSWRWQGSLTKLGKHTLRLCRDHRNTAAQTQRRGGVPRGYALFPHLSVKQISPIVVGEAVAAARDRRTCASRCWRRSPVRPRRSSHQIGFLGGQKQQVALARAIVFRPEYCLWTSHSPRSTREPASECRSRSVTCNASSASPRSR